MRDASTRCTICRRRQLRPGAATVTLERGSTVLVVRNVPARVCETCGEEYVEQEVTARLLAFAQDAVRAGVQVEVREYVAACRAADRLPGTRLPITDPADLDT